jgi:WD40 repeat protein
MERREHRRAWGSLSGVALVALVVAACGGPSPSGSPAVPSPTPGGTEVANGSVAPEPSATGTQGSPAPSPGIAPGEPVAGGPLAARGSIAAIREDGALAVTRADGTSVVLTDPEHAAFGFPTWSPDGTRIALVRTSLDDISIVVFSARQLEGDGAVTPTTLFRSTTIAPFYLYWTPDGRDVSYLASEGDQLALRMSAADGSDAIVGSGTGTVVRSGNPFYFEWVARDRLFAHVGTGADAFLGEIGRDGKAIGPALPTPGTFRAPEVSRDGGWLAFSRDGGGGPGQVVVAERNGSGEHTMPVIGPAAVVFDPSGRTVASIGATRAEVAQPEIPVGPLRLMDVASGTVRTLLDGLVVGFWWSPDGRTIAALRVQPVERTGPSVQPVASLAPSASASPDTEVRLFFLDVARGNVRSQPVVVPGARFIDQFLTYFDQYALSHAIWAPDSSSLLMPESDPAGTHLVVRHPDGSGPRVLDGEVGFWSP